MTRGIRTNKLLVPASQEVVSTLNRLFRAVGMTATNTAIPIASKIRARGPKES